MMVLGVFLAVVGGLASFAAGIWLVVLAFRESVLWGLATLLIPFAGLVFVIKFWDEAKRPFLISLASGAVYGLGVFMILGSGASQMAARMAEMDQSEWQTTGSEDFLQESTPVPTLTPTATPTFDEIEEDVRARLEAAEAWTPSPQPSATPTLPPHYEKITIREILQERMGERVLLRLRSGKWVTVTLRALDEDILDVKQRMGGGAMEYTIEVDDVVEVREE